MLCICLGEASLAMTVMSLASDAPFPGAHLGVIKVSGPTPPRRGFMARDFDGWPIAEQRIAKEARERTGKLDLAGLGLEFYRYRSPTSPAKRLGSPSQTIRPCSRT